MVALRATRVGMALQAAAPLQVAIPARVFASARAGDVRGWLDGALVLPTRRICLATTVVALTRRAS